MERLKSCLPTIRWIIGTVICGVVLSNLFKFVPWPLWLRGDIIGTFSVIVGPTALNILLARGSGRTWDEALAPSRSSLDLIAAMPAASVVAVLCYFITTQYTSDATSQMIVVRIVAIGFVLVADTALSKYRREQNQKELEAIRKDLYRFSENSR